MRATIEAKQPDGTYKLHNDISTTSLVLSEPDPGLFGVPSDYVETKPSDMQHKQLERFGVPWTDNQEKVAQHEDAVYLQKH